MLISQIMLIDVVYACMSAVRVVASCTIPTNANVKFSGQRAPSIAGDAARARTGMFLICLTTGFSAAGDVSMSSPGMSRTLRRRNCRRAGSDVAGVE